MSNISSGNFNYIQAVLQKLHANKINDPQKIIKGIKLWGGNNSEIVARISKEISSGRVLIPKDADEEWVFNLIKNKILPEISDQDKLLNLRKELYKKKFILFRAQDNKNISSIHQTILDLLKDDFNLTDEDIEIIRREVVSPEEEIKK